jgi:hypothetical protein
MIIYIIVYIMYVMCLCVCGQGREREKEAIVCTALLPRPDNPHAQGRHNATTRLLGQLVSVGKVGADVEGVR